MAAIAPSCGLSFLFAGFLLMFAGAARAATTYTVGDSSGWTLGYDYTTWASAKNFQVGDILVFNYASAAHTVEEVSQSAYTACSSSNALSSDSSGTTTITLTTAGAHYFICGVGTHCSSGGMKLAVNVAAATSTTPATPATGGGSSTTPATTPSTPAGSTATPSSILSPPSATTDHSNNAATVGPMGLAVAGLAGLVAAAVF